MDPAAGLAAGAAAAVSSYAVSKYQSVRFKALGITGVDVHKPERPVTAEMGGLAVLVGLAVGSLVYLGLTITSEGLMTAFAAGGAVLGLTGAVGIADDLYEIRQRYKPFMIVAATIPLVVFLMGRSSVHIPLIGSIGIGLLYPLVAVPLAVTTSANFSNMLAGFNGLEAGMGMIAIGTLSLLSFANGHPAVGALGTIMTLSYAGFIALNWYPARLFPGDTGTLMAGSAVAVIGLLSGLEFEAIVMSIPAAMDFTLKAAQRLPFSGRHLHGNASVLPDGTLKAAGYPALAHAFMEVSPIKEKGLVVSLLAMEGLFALVAASVAVFVA